MAKETTTIHLGASPRPWWLYLAHWLHPLEDATQIDKQPEKPSQRPTQPRFGAQAAESSAITEQVLAPSKPQAADSLDCIDLPKLLTDVESGFLRSIERNLRDDAEDAAAANEVGPSSAAVKTCLHLAELIAPRVALAPRLKWAAFLEDTGGVSLVLQSLVTDRRLTCEVSIDGDEVSTTQIDEAMTSKRLKVLTGDENTLRELGEWVVRRV